MMRFATTISGETVCTVSKNFKPKLPDVSLNSVNASGIFIKIALEDCAPARFYFTRFLRGGQNQGIAHLADEEQDHTLPQLIYLLLNSLKPNLDSTR